MSAAEVLDRMLAEGPVPTSSLEFAITCPACDASVEFMRYAPPLPTEVRAVMRCTGHPRHEWLVLLRAVLIAHPPGSDADPVCGTGAGYARHRRRGEPACDACRAAHAREQHDRTRRPGR